MDVEAVVAEGAEQRPGGRVAGREPVQHQLPGAGGGHLLDQQGQHLGVGLLGSQHRPPASPAPSGPRRLPAVAGPGDQRQQPERGVALADQGDPQPVGRVPPHPVAQEASQAQLSSKSAWRPRLGGAVPGPPQRPDLVVAQQVRLASHQL